MDLAKKAKRWDDKQVSTLKAKKERLSEELRQAMKNSRKESEIQTIKSQIQGLETRLNSSRLELEKTKKKIKSLQEQCDKMQKQLDAFEPTIIEIEKKYVLYHKRFFKHHFSAKWIWPKKWEYFIYFFSLRAREQEIEEMKEKMNTVEDRIFKGFCDSIGVSNIRQYEERELKSQQDREKKKMEHENQINRISNQLEYERKREEQLLTNQRKFERTVQDDEVCCYFFIFLQNFFSKFYGKVGAI